MRTTNYKANKLIGELSHNAGKTWPDMISRAKKAIKDKTGLSVDISPYKDNTWSINWFNNGYNCYSITAEMLVDSLHSIIIPFIESTLTLKTII